jgi:hypothetical protein
MPCPKREESHVTPQFGNGKDTPADLFKSMYLLATTPEKSTRLASAYIFTQVWNVGIVNWKRLYSSFILFYGAFI